MKMRKLAKTKNNLLAFIAASLAVVGSLRAQDVTAPAVTILNGAEVTAEVGIGCVTDVTLTATWSDPDSSTVFFSWMVEQVTFAALQEAQMEADGWTITPSNAPTVTRTYGGTTETYVVVQSTTGVMPFAYTYPLGEFNVIAEATDPAGNVGSAVTQLHVQDTTAPTLVWTYNGNPLPDGSTTTIYASQLPITLAVDSFDYCEMTLNKTFTVTAGTATVTYTPTTMTIESATGASSVYLWAQANDISDNYSPSQAVTIQILADPVITGKANEGLGNGVDPNTPGHLHNGQNDDPQYRPGKPGARNKPHPNS